MAIDPAVHDGVGSAGLSRGVMILIAIAAMIAVSGFFMGLRQSSNFAERTQAESTARVIASTRGGAQLVVNGDIPTAPLYSDLPATLTTPNRDWVQTLESLPNAKDLSSKEVTALSNQERNRILKARASRRAYDGAPPTVPHPIDQASSDSCVICHGIDTSVLIDSRRPPVMSHEMYVNCIQCHVPASGPVESMVPVWSGPRISVTAFAGRQGRGPGSRAYPGAPPTMPHPSVMRENCMGCHDAGRPNAIRTSHPERTNCSQCHAPSATLDRRVADLEGVRRKLIGIVLAPPPKEKAPTPIAAPGDSTSLTPDSPGTVPPTQKAKP